MKKIKKGTGVYLSDLMIHLSECLKEVDNINIEWRILNKYCSDYLDDNNFELEINYSPEKALFKQQKEKQK